MTPGSWWSPNPVRSAPGNPGTRASRIAVLIGMTVVVVASGCATADPPASTTPRPATDAGSIDRLFELIAERLAVASDVARTKWNTRAPIEDLPRERQVIEGAANRAADYGLTPDAVEDFFTAQIEASKVIQRAMHSEWTTSRQPPFTTVADLEKDIRPHLDRLTPEMLRALAAAVPVLKQPGGRRLLESRSRAVVIQAPGGRPAMTEAIAPLLSIASGTSRSRGTPPAVGSRHAVLFQAQRARPRRGRREKRHEESLTCAR